MKDLFNRVALKRSLDAKAAIVDATSYVGQIIDRAGYESVVLAICPGALAGAGAKYDVLVEEDNDSGLATATAVAAADLQVDGGLAAGQAILTGAQASFALADANKQFKIGYIGFKRYLRVTVKANASSTSLFVSGPAVLGNARHQPAGATQTP